MAPASAYAPEEQAVLTVYDGPRYLLRRLIHDDDALAMFLRIRCSSLPGLSQKYPVPVAPVTTPMRAGSIPLCARPASAMAISAATTEIMVARVICDRLRGFMAEKSASASGGSSTPKSLVRSLVSNRENRFTGLRPPTSAAPARGAIKAKSGYQTQGRL